MIARLGLKDYDLLIGASGLGGSLGIQFFAWGTQSVARRVGMRVERLCEVLRQIHEVVCVQSLHKMNGLIGARTTYSLFFTVLSKLIVFGLKLLVKLLH